MPAPFDNRRLQLEALRRTLASGQASAADVPAVGEEELREAVRRAALSRLREREGDMPDAGAPALGETGARDGEAGVHGAYGAMSVPGARSVPAADAAAMPAASAPAPAFPASAAIAGSASPAVPAAASSASSAAPAAASPAAPAASLPARVPPFPAPDPPADRTMREYVSELLNPTKDRGANVLVEPDHEAIAQGKGRHYAKTGGHARSLLAFFLEFLLIFILALALIFPVRAFVAEYYYIPSGSMQDTLQIDDRILSEKLSYYFDTPKQGQIVTFEGTKEEAGQTLIKRVIAVGGQTVNLRDGAVYVDGEKLDEPYTEGKESLPLSNSNGVTYPYKVPEGEIWVMGDNRTNSLDSRVFGSVPVKNVTGHAFWRYWPLSGFGALE